MDTESPDRNYLSISPPIEQQIRETLAKNQRKINLRMAVRVSGDAWERGFEDYTFNNR